ncbi:MAG: hypothetical protein R6V12_19330, partial [Candidatus Hydrogenedentota bacterium]
MRIFKALFFVIIIASCVSNTSAAPVRLAFLAAEKSVEQMGPHNRAACEVAQTLGNATLLHAGGETGFRDATGASRELTGFDVLWYHQGDNINRTGLYSGTSLAAIRTFAENGGGVLLSGGALAMVAQLRLEWQIRPQRHQLENWREPAAMVPLEHAHPVFSGLHQEEGQVWLSRGGCPAVADFYWGGPVEGMVLANSPQGV